MAPDGKISELHGVNIFLRSLRKTLLAAVLFDLSVAIYPLFVPSAWPFLLIVVSVSLSIGLLAAIPHYLLSRRDLIARRRSRGWREVVTSRWHNEGKTKYRKSARWGDRAYVLLLSVEAGRQKAVLATLDGRGLMAFQEFPRWPGFLRQMLRQQALVGELYVRCERFDERIIEVVKEGKDYLVRVSGINAVYCVGGHAILRGGAVLARRDMLGWRVTHGLSPLDSAVCALVLMAGLPDLR
jgi:hypothetical protein